MAKDMYQKRKERKENKFKNEDNKSLHSATINWDISTDGKLRSTLDKIRICEK